MKRTLMSFLIGYLFLVSPYGYAEDEHEDGGPPAWVSGKGRGAGSRRFAKGREGMGRARDNTEEGFDRAYEQAPEQAHEGIRQGRSGFRDGLNRGGQGVDEGERGFRQGRPSSHGGPGRANRGR
jgi:hypothetical protein